MEQNYTGWHICIENKNKKGTNMLLKTEQNVKTLNKTLQVDRFVLKFRT